MLRILKAGNNIQTVKIKMALLSHIVRITTGLITLIVFISRCPLWHEYQTWAKMIYILQTSNKIIVDNNFLKM